MKFKKNQKVRLTQDITNEQIFSSGHITIHKYHYVKGSEAVVVKVSFNVSGESVWVKFPNGKMWSFRVSANLFEPVDQPKLYETRMDISDFDLEYRQHEHKTIVLPKGRQGKLTKNAHSGIRLDASFHDAITGKKWAVEAKWFKKVK